MTPLQAWSLARAVELDDAFPDDVCPGCGQDIAGWRAYVKHRMPIPPRTRRRVMSSRVYRGCATPWPFMEEGGGGCDVCVWTRDYLEARAHRRAYIAAHRVAEAVAVLARVGLILQLRGR